MISSELAVIGLALAVLVIDLWTPRDVKHRLGYLAAAGLVVILARQPRWRLGGRADGDGIQRHVRAGRPGLVFQAPFSGHRRSWSC